MLEMRMILAEVPWYLEMALRGVMEGWLDQKSYLTWRNRPLWRRKERQGSRAIYIYIYIFLF